LSNEEHGLFGFYTTSDPHNLPDLSAICNQSFCWVDGIALARSYASVMKKMHRIAPPWVKAALPCFPRRPHPCQYTDESTSNAERWGGLLL